MFLPILYTVLTTVCAFLSLVFSGINPIIDFGLIVLPLTKFGSNGELKDDNGTLLSESNVVETAKRLALFLLDEGLCKFGQDLKHQQQVADILANIFMDIYVAESTILRAKKMLTNPNTHHSVEEIAKISLFLPITAPFLRFIRKYKHL